jgi:hypothetical protein
MIAHLLTITASSAKEPTLTHLITGVVMHHRSLFVAMITLTACRGAGAVAGMSPVPVAVTVSTSNAHEHAALSNSEPLPVTELAKARRATARYQNLIDALKDGYVDIGVVLPNMGRHLLKEALLDATFDAERPEFLVYMEDLGGRMKLVAVEYAVPLKLRTRRPTVSPAALTSGSATSDSNSGHCMRGSSGTIRPACSIRRIVGCREDRRTTKKPQNPVESVLEPPALAE